MEIDDLRSNFPEFTDDEVYTDPMVTFWSGVAIKQLKVDRWGDLYDHGIYLCTAHYLTLAVTDQRAVAAGGTGGGTSGVIINESAGSVSVGYDVQSSIETDAGHWNLTSYGRQFIRLARMCGMGGMQLGYCED